MARALPRALNGTGYTPRMNSDSPALHLGAILSFDGDPGDAVDSPRVRYWPHGALGVADGRIVAVGAARDLMADRSLRDTVVVDHGDGLILPGFIDTHTHYPQTDSIGASGRNLLEWLERSIFPAEARFSSAEVARETADFFLDELLANGTTTALVMGTVHETSATAFLEASRARDLRMIAGPVLMDRNAPRGLLDTAAHGEALTRRLIETWHGRDRLSVAITPRFAPTSSPAQLASAGRLARDYPTAYVHSHLAENAAEVRWVAELYPEARSYLDVYDRAGLLRERAIYAHGLHLDAHDRERMAGSGAAIAFCPTSNAYLGSGLFDLAAADAARLRYALATDIGAGTSFSLLRTMGAAYETAQRQGQALSPLRAFYLATRAGAEILHLADRIGSLVPGYEADFIVLDPRATPLLARRMQHAPSLHERLQLWLALGDDRAIASTWIRGVAVPRVPPR